MYHQIETQPRETPVCSLSIFSCRRLVGFVWILRLFSVNIYLVYFQYSVRIIAHVHRKRRKPALRFRVRPPISGPTYCIVPLIERPIYCIMTEYNNL